MRRRPRVFALVVLALTCAAVPAAARRDAKGREIEAWSGEPLFELTSPWRGARLAGGESTNLAWHGTAALAAEAVWLEEWEAFLSLDAGKSYPIRLTPHLDLARRSFSIRLPDQPTTAARLMFRLGNERRELEIELPWTFEIVAVDARDFAPRGWAFAPGEVARGGTQGVVSWVEGDRDGARAIERHAGNESPGIRAVASGAGLAMATVGPAQRQPSPPLSEPFSHPAAEVTEATGTAAQPEVEPSAFNPRIRTCRQNE